MEPKAKTVPEKTTASQIPAVRTDKTIVDQVLTKVQKFVEYGEIKLPSDYSPENALKSAFLLLQEVKTTDKKPVLESCTKESIANSLLDMVVQGLSPMKKQCAFIAYGDRLQCQREYPGTIALARRYANLEDFSANVIYSGDVFKYEVDPVTGRKRIIEHQQDLDNINIANIKGAYAVLMFKDKISHVEIMTIQQIQTAWKQGKANGSSGAHMNFTDQMAIKTVIGRACKNFINSSDDGNLHLEEKEPENTSIQREINEHNGKESIAFDNAEVVEATAEIPKAENSTAPQAEQESKNNGNQAVQPSMNF